MLKMSLDAVMFISVRNAMKQNQEQTFFKLYDYETMSEIKYKTCKDCRNKVKETKGKHKTKPRNKHEHLNS